MTMWTIKGEKGMTGTVEQIGYLLWHITSPVKLDISYGGPDAVPGTYVDALGRDQMVAIEKDVASKGVFFDENYTGDFGERWYPQDMVTVTNIGDNVTRRVLVIGSKTWTINGEKGMIGFVEKLSTNEGLLWHITSPVTKTLYYGGPDAIPGTYVDSLGRDQMVAIEKDVASKGVYLDENYTGDLGEKWYPQDKVTITYPNGTDYTARVSVISVPPSKTWTIKGEKGMTGTVEQIGYLLWHITSPVKLDIGYGGPDAVPGTYVDALGRDQMVAIEKDVASKGVYLDENYTGDLGEKWYPQDNVTLTYPNGTDYTARVSVISIPGTGSLYIKSTPGEADIIINGQLQGVKTPATITDLTAGSHEVKLTKTGYQVLTQTVTIIAGTTTNMDVSLTVLPGISTLKISSAPAGARVFIDGADALKVTPATITNLSSGDHTYKLVLSGYKDATGTFTMELGKNTIVSVVMTKPEAAVGTGTILGISLLGMGILGAVIIATRRKKPEYTVPGYKGG